MTRKRQQIKNLMRHQLSSDELDEVFAANNYSNYETGHITHAFKVPKFKQRYVQE